MAALDLALRFATLSQLCVLAVLIFRQYRHTIVGRCGLIFLYCLGCYLLCPLVANRWQMGLLALPIFLGCFSVAAAFWLLARAWFVDRVRVRWPHLLLALLPAAASFPRHYLPARALDVAPVEIQQLWAILPQMLSLGFVVAALAQAQFGRGPDLVEARRRFRDVFVAVSGAYIILVLAVEIFMSGKGPAPLLDVINVGGILVVTTIVMVLVSRLQPIEFANAARPAEDAGARGALAPVDQKMIDDIRRLVETDKGYREDGLTITRLAERIGGQEYRVRRAINRHLGFRNFNEFLNHHRVAEARARLVDPKSVHLPVLTIAMDLGYQSLGPFNRAFKEQTGMTPVQYRRANFTPADPADFEKS